MHHSRKSLENRCPGPWAAARRTPSASAGEECSTAQLAARGERRQARRKLGAVEVLTMAGGLGYSMVVGCT